MTKTRIADKEIGECDALRATRGGVHKLRQAGWVLVTDERISVSAEGAISFRTAPTGALKELLESAPPGSVLLARPWAGDQTHTLRLASDVSISSLPDWSGLRSAIVTAPRLLGVLGRVVRSAPTHLIVFGPGVTSVLMSVALLIGRWQVCDTETLLLTRTSVRDALPAMTTTTLRPFVVPLARAIQAIQGLFQRCAFNTRAYVSRPLASQWGDPHAPISPEVDWRALEDIAAEPLDAAHERAVLFLGRLSREKGADIAIGAFLRADPAGCELIVAGDGPERVSLEAMVRRSMSTSAGSVRFVGQIEHIEALKLLRRVFLTLVPSRAEAFGLVAFEALAAGSRVLHSGRGGLLEATAGHPAARPVFEEGQEAWADALNRELTMASTGATNAGSVGWPPLTELREQRGWVSLVDLVKGSTT